MERYLQLCGEDNIQVCQPSNAAQYFHLLRRQALDPVARPLVAVTPKGLLRLKEAAGGIRLRYIGRPWRASPSEGYPTAHLIEQDRIAREALTL
jgi:2-oxoglutarate dehydrogenase complex dehydrogenase (E1) component-like enzyme